jgi:hypothetical protein
MLSGQKLHRPELGEVSYHWAMGKQQGGYRNRIGKGFSRSLMLPSPKRQLDPWVLQKQSGDFADPLPFVAAP